MTEIREHSESRQQKLLLLLTPFHPRHWFSPIMPVEVSDIKQFIEICRRKDASCKPSRVSFLPFFRLTRQIARAPSDLFSSSSSLYIVK